MSPNLSSGHFAQNKLIYEQVIYNTLNLVGLATTLNAAEARRYAQLHTVSYFITIVKHVLVCWCARLVTDGHTKKLWMKFWGGTCLGSRNRRLDFGM